MRNDLPVLLAAALALLAAGCGDEADKDAKPRSGDPNATLLSGTYVVSKADIHKDGCDLNYSAGDLNGSVLSVTVAGASVDINGIPATLSGGNLSGSSTSAGEDVFGDGSCLVDITTSDDGTVPEDNQMDVVESVVVDNASGAGCSQVPVDLPCETRYFARLTLQ